LAGLDTAQRELLRSIEGLLRMDWDPIGGVPADEYDTYAGQVFSKLMSGAVASDIAAYLDHIESEFMGLALTEPARERNQSVAARAVELAAKARRR
jgi:hypothetical protein